MIPEGEYGADTVLIWDRGHYRDLKEGEERASLAEQLEDGHVTAWLEGEKLRGGYALIRTQLAQDEGWRLIKMDDDAADARSNPTSTEPQSMVTGRILKDTAAEERDSRS